MSRLKWGPTTKDDTDDTAMSKRNKDFETELPAVMKVVCGGDP
jgi:hypothetical protein